MNIHNRIARTRCLTPQQKESIQQLVSACCLHDGISLSYPTDLDTEGCEHYLLTAPDQTLLGALCLIFFDDNTAECSAFVHPRHRRQGCFSRLFDLALDSCEESDILFPVSERCPDTIAVLRALSAEFDYREHQMELSLTPEAVSGSHAALPLVMDAAAHQEDTLWSFLYPGVPGTPTVGSCRTLPVSETCVCLHHVKVLPQFRGLGYGTSMLQLLLPRLYQQGIHKVILQVTDDNAPAMALYKKTGFRITETLSYYLY